MSSEQKVDQGWDTPSHEEIPKITEMHVAGLEASNDDAVWVVAGMHHVMIRTIGRTKVDWRMEESILNQMANLAPKLTAHQYEWESLRLMVETLRLQRKIDYIILEVEYFDPNTRPIDAEWKRRIAEQTQAIKDQSALRKKVRSHFAKRYHGQAFNEWISELFDLSARKLKECVKASRRKLAVARRYYARP